jgi:hypothetical protein
VWWTADGQNLELARVVVPIITFVLGSVLTVAPKAWEQGRNATKTSAKEVVRLTKEWYGQIHLQLHARATLQPDATNPALYDYVHNRLILPDLLFHLEILRKHRRAAELTRALEEFLCVVTDYTPAPHRRRFAPREWRWRRRMTLSPGRMAACHPLGAFDQPNQLLVGLDRRIQKHYAGGGPSCVGGRARRARGCVRCSAASGVARRH